MYFKSEIGFSLMAGVRVCEYWKNLEIQCLAENITVHCYFYFCCVCELNYLHFFTATVLKRVVHPLLLPFLCTLSCVLGSQTVIHVYIHLFNVCGVGLEAVAISTVERIVRIMLLLWAEKVLCAPSLMLWMKKCTL